MNEQRTLLYFDEILVRQRFCKLRVFIYTASQYYSVVKYNIGIIASLHPPNYKPLTLKVSNPL